MAIYTVVITPRGGKSCSSLLDELVVSVHVVGEDHSLKREDRDGNALEKTETFSRRQKQWRRSWEDGNDVDALGKTEMETLSGRQRWRHSWAMATPRVDTKITIAPPI